MPTEQDCQPVDHLQSNTDYDQSFPIYHDAHGALLGGLSRYCQVRQFADGSTECAEQMCDPRAFLLQPRSLLLQEYLFN